MSTNVPIAASSTGSAPPAEEEDDDLMGLYDDNDVDNEGNNESKTQPQQLTSINSLIGSKSGESEDSKVIHTTMSTNSAQEKQAMMETTTTTTTATTTTTISNNSNENGVSNNDKKNVNETNNGVTTAAPKTPIQSSKQQQQQQKDSQTSSNTSNKNNNSANSATPSYATRSSTYQTTTPKQTPSSQNTNTTTTTTTTNEVEALNDEIATLLLTNKINLTTSSKLQSMLRENVSLKEKITKLKTLLARSSKVSKETKQELDKAQREVMRLSQRVESLANRPTHMDLLADFETNFDRALMSLHNGDDDDDTGHNNNNNNSNGSTQQSGGEDTRPQILTSVSSNGGEGGENVSSLLLSELSQTKSRMEHLEALNASLMNKAAKITKDNEQYVSQMERQTLKMSNLQLELRMAKMETENATREVKAKAASLSEMQMEIDLVTRSAMDANVRAAEGLEVAKSIKSDKAQVEELKAKVAALQEWAVASAEAKEAILEENKLLERRLNELEKKDDDDDVEFKSTITLKSDNVSPRSKDKITERKLWSKTSSLVIGAGMTECRLIELGENEVMDFETVILKWKFDITPNDVDIIFSMLKGKFDGRDRIAMKNAHALIKERNVFGGGGGEVQGAFVIQNACTLVWSNEHSWVRPKTIKYHIEAFAVI